MSIFSTIGSVVPVYGSMTIIARMFTRITILSRIRLERTLALVSWMFVTITETIVVTFRIVSPWVLVMRITVGVLRSIPIVIIVVAPRRTAAVRVKKEIKLKKLVYHFDSGFKQNECKD